MFDATMASHNTHLLLNAEHLIHTVHTLNATAPRLELGYDELDSYYYHYYRFSMSAPSRLI